MNHEMISLGRNALGFRRHRNWTVGTYEMRLSISGDRAGNYRLADGTETVMFTITRRPTNYVIAAQTGYYGGQIMVCGQSLCRMAPGLTPGGVSFSNLVYNDNAPSAIAPTQAARVVDAAGNPVAFDASLQVGVYDQTYSGGMQGSRISNYELLPTGNTSNALTVKRALIGYSTTSGVYLRNFGFLADGPGGAHTLTGVMPGDSVSIAVGLLTKPSTDPTAQLITDVTTLPNGIYYWDAIAFSADPTKYELGDSRFRFVGTLTVDGLSVFNTTFANPQLSDGPPPDGPIAVFDGILGVGAPPIQGVI
jgi:hypothetical protein